MDGFVTTRQPDSASCRHDSTGLQDSKMSLAPEAIVGCNLECCLSDLFHKPTATDGRTYKPWGSRPPSRPHGKRTDLTQCDIVYIFPSLSALSNATGSETSIPIFSAIHQRRNSVSPYPTKAHEDRNLTFDLLYRPREPPPRADQPKTNTVRHHNSHCDNGVIQRLRIYWIYLRKDEDDGNEHDPEHRRDGNGQGERSEVERSLGEVVIVEDAECDGYT